MELKRVLPILLSVVVVLLPACGDDTGPIVPACVKASCVKTLDLNAPSPRLLKNGTLQLEASPSDASGAPVPPAVVSWRSRNTSIATVDANGLVAGVEFGSTAILASAGG